MIQKTLFALVFLLLSICSQAQETPKTEIRAVWLTTIGGIDWPRTYNAAQQKQELSQTLDRLKEGGINTIILQTRVRATTIYPSAIEPWDGCITGHPGRAASYDPLQFAIDECHKRGMQLHAWVVTIPIGKWDKYGCQQLRKKHPNLVKKIGDEGYMNPEAAGTADYIAKCCREIVERYDVDGIHLDYIRYPETWPRPSAKVRKGKNAKGAPAAKNLSAKERRDNITRIVDAVYREVKSRKPWVMLSCSPIGKHDDLTRYRSGGWNARSAVYQDVQQWLKDGKMDALFPMMYFRDNHFFPFAIDWKERSNGRFIVPGLGIYFLDPKQGREWQLSDVTRQMYVSRELGLGHCYFRSKFFTDNFKGIYDFGHRFDAVPALIPPMTWASSERPAMPAEASLVQGRLSWTDTNQKGGLQYNVYNVYASTDYPVDVTKAENLVATRLTKTSIRVPDDGFTNYAITCQDRFGLESAPRQLFINGPQTPYLEKPLITISDGRPVKLPVKPSTLDAEYLIIETLQGQQLRFAPYRGQTLDVSNLPDGIYQLRSLGSKGYTHRVGFFSIKRKR